MLLDTQIQTAGEIPASSGVATLTVRGNEQVEPLLKNAVSTVTVLVGRRTRSPQVRQGPKVPFTWSQPGEVERSTPSRRQERWSISRCRHGLNWQSLCDANVRRTRRRHAPACLLEALAIGSSVCLRTQRLVCGARQPDRQTVQLFVINARSVARSGRHRGVA